MVQELGVKQVERSPRSNWLGRGKWFSWRGFRPREVENGMPDPESPICSADKVCILSPWHQGLSCALTHSASHTHFVDYWSLRRRNVKPSHPGSLTSYCQGPDFIIWVISSDWPTTHSCRLSFNRQAWTNPRVKGKQEKLWTGAGASLVGYHGKGGYLSKLLHLQMLQGFSGFLLFKQATKLKQEQATKLTPLQN